MKLVLVLGKKKETGLELGSRMDNAKTLQAVPGHMLCHGPKIVYTVPRFP